MSNWYSRIGGVGLCLVAAGLSTWVFHGMLFKSFLPFLFLPIVVFVATRFGSWPGILGTLGGAAIFATFLFEPAFSLRVSDSVQKDNLVWMVIIGIVASEILGVLPKNQTARQSQPEDSTAL
jgi:two-component system, OmpR family, sensor histidine kinase KdpD